MYTAAETTEITISKLTSWEWRNMNIEFIEESHTYLVDGVIVPSVTQIMKPMSEAYYADIPSFVLNNAAGRGTRVHKTIEMYEKTGEMSTDEDVIPFLKNYLVAKKIHGFQPVEIEFQLTEGTFAGTIDMLAEMDKELVIIDLKATSKFNKSLAEVQLAGYVELCEKNKKYVGKTYILHLTKDTFKLHKVEPNYATWIDLKNEYFETL
jgi:hypothetical protein